LGVDDETSRNIVVLCPDVFAIGPVLNQMGAKRRRVVDVHR
jgi:hypothetical protein